MRHIATQSQYKLSSCFYLHLHSEVSSDFHKNFPQELQTLYEGEVLLSCLCETSNNGKPASHVHHNLVEAKYDLDL